MTAVRRVAWFRLGFGVLQIGCGAGALVAFVWGGPAPLVAGLLTACVGLVALSRFWWRGR